MKKGYLIVVLLLSCCALFSSCLKNRPYVTTTNPSMTATIGGNYKFVGAYCVPSTLDTQVHDTSTTLIITGYSSDKVYPYDKIVLTVSDYNGKPGTFSIVQGQASAGYSHSIVQSYALGGVISITKVTSTSIIGYFSFNTNDGVAITDGAFNVNIP